MPIGITWFISAVGQGLSLTGAAKPRGAGVGPAGPRVTMPFPLRFPLAFDGKLLGQALRIFTDTVTRWRRAPKLCPRATAALGIWRRLAELTARRTGRDGADCPACLKKPRQAPETRSHAPRGCRHGLAAACRQGSPTLPKNASK
jgi:hypothetical protein